MILPRRKCVLLSPLQPAEALQALRAALAPARNWRQKMLRQQGGGFTGEVTSDGFSISRDINYRNSFLPFVTGKIVTGYPGSRVEVLMKMHRSVVGFLILWLGIATIGFTNSAFIYSNSPGGHGDPAQIFIPAGFLLFGIGLAHGGFRPEANKAERFLVETLRAEVELPPDSNRAL